MAATSTVQQLKLTLVSTLGLSKDALHIYVGLAAMIVVMVIFRKPLRSWLPWLIVLCLACAGEAVDARDDLGSLGRWRWQASLHDVLNTCFWPTVFFTLARFSSLFRDRSVG